MEPVEIYARGKGEPPWPSLVYMAYPPGPWWSAFYPLQTSVTGAALVLVRLLWLVLVTLVPSSLDGYDSWGHVMDDFT